MLAKMLCNHLPRKLHQCRVECDRKSEMCSCSQREWENSREFPNLPLIWDSECTKKDQKNTPNTVEETNSELFGNFWCFLEKVGVFYLY